MPAIENLPTAAVAELERGRPVPVGRVRADWRIEGILGLAVTGFAILVVFHRLYISAWYDEAHSYALATMPLGTFLRHWAWGSESNMFLYYMTLRGWLALVTGIGAAPTEMLLRFPSAVFAVAASVVVYVTGRRLFGRVAGVVAAGLYTVNFLQLILAQNARAYSLQLLLLGISWLALLIGIEDGRRRWWIAYTLATILSVYAALFSGLVIVAQVVALAALLLVPGPWRERVQRSIRSIVTSLTIVFIAVIPLGVDAYLHGGQNWVAPAHLQDLKTFLLFLSGSSRFYMYLVLMLALVAILLAAQPHWGRWRWLGRQPSNNLGAAVALGSWFAVPIAVSFALTQHGLNLHLFFQRYLVVVVPPLCLLAGLAISSLPFLPVRSLAAAAMIVAAWAPLSFYYQLAQVQDFQEPTVWIQARYQPGDGLVCEPVVECSVPMSYYLDAYPGQARLDPDSPGWFDWQTNQSIPTTAKAIDRYASRHRRIFFVYAPLGRSAAADAAASRVEDDLVSRGFKAVGGIRVHATAVDTAVTLFEAS